MANKDLREKTEKELQKMLVEARKEIRKFRFSISGAAKKNIKEVQIKKTLVAQILTELRARELASENK